MSDLFGDKGYNIYGYDRGGLDEYGFQTNGYDKDRWNWFFNGPHYLWFYFHTVTAVDVIYMTPQQ